jgi:hypothetical protein
MKPQILVASLTVLSVPVATRASTLAVNFVNNAADAVSGGPQDQAGFTALVVANASGAGGTVLNAGTVGGVTVSLQNVDTNGGNNRIRSIDRGETRVYNGVYSNLSVGWVGNEDGGDFFLLTLSGVTAGPHNWTSYHIDNGTGASGNGNQNGMMTIQVSVDGGANYSAVATNYEILDAELSLGESAVPSDPANFTFSTTFTANGTDDVVFRFLNTAVGFTPTAADPGQDFTVINGFEVSPVPEPSSCFVTAGAAVCLMARRRRRN